MQAYDHKNEAVSPVEAFDADRMEKLLKRDDVDHVRVFRKKVEKARAKNKAARMARRKQRRK